MQQEDTSLSVTTRSTGIRYGLITSVISIAYFVILNVAQINVTEGAWQYVGWIITAALIFFAHKYYKENTDGFMGYGQGIGIAFWLGLVSSALYAVFFYIYIKFIDTHFVENIKQKQLETFEKQGMSSQQIDQAMKMGEMFTTPEAMFIMTLIFGIIGAVIIGLIVTIFTQKKSPETNF